MSQSGPLAIYEKNVRLADNELLEEGNYNQVPTTNVLKTAGQEYSNRHKLDEDIFKELRVFREMTRKLDNSSIDVKGK